MAQWTQAYVDSLPDSSFLFIAPGGKKVDGKTEPLSLRKLPYKNTDGKLDHAHLANALARLDATQGLSADDKDAIRAKAQKLLSEEDDDNDKLGAVTETYDRNDCDASEVTALSATPISVDKNGNLPTRFPLFTTFDLPKSNRGHFTVDVNDLTQMKEHFDAGKGFPTDDASTGLMLDYEHRRNTEKAAAWIKALDFVLDQRDPKRATLFADNVEWTKEGAEAVKNGDYKMISPTGAFGKKNGRLSVYAHHTDSDNVLPNLLMGAGLVNEPFQSMMPPIRMGAKTDELGSEENNLIYVYDVQQNKESSMNLDALRVKEKDALTADEVKFLFDNTEKLKAEWTPEELGKFGFVVQQGETLSAEDRDMLATVKSGKKKVVDNNDDNDGDEDVSDADRQTLADIKSGKKKVVDAGDKLDALSQEDRDTLSAIQKGDKRLVDADTLTKLDKLDRLEAVAEEFEYNKAKQFVREQLSRGALKSDQEETTVKMLLSMEGNARKAFEDHLSALPSNELLADELGHSNDVNVDINDELKQKTLEVLYKAKTAGETLSYAQAQDRLMREDADIKGRYDASKLSK